MTFLADMLCFVQIIFTNSRVAWHAALLLDKWHLEMRPNADLSKHDAWPLYGKCYRNRVCGTSCNSLLFGPIKRREKPLLIAKWRQKAIVPQCRVKWLFNHFNRSKVEFGLRVNLGLPSQFHFQMGEICPIWILDWAKFYSLICPNKLNEIRLKLTFLVTTGYDHFNWKRCLGLLWYLLAS